MYSSSVCYCHLFFISSASVRSLLFLSFLVLLNGLGPGHPPWFPWICASQKSCWDQKSFQRAIQISSSTPRLPNLLSPLPSFHAAPCQCPRPSNWSFPAPSFLCTPGSRPPHLTAASCVARGTEAVGTLRAVLAGCHIPTGAG